MHEAQSSERWPAVHPRLPSIAIHQIVISEDDVAGAPIGVDRLHFIPRPGQPGIAVEIEPVLYVPQLSIKSEEAIGPVLVSLQGALEFSSLLRHISAQRFQSRRMSYDDTRSHQWHRSGIESAYC
jgi:hypothetical protein